MSDLEKLCRDLEHFETPEWAAAAILEKEILTENVVDPCCGTGILSIIARSKNSFVYSLDKNNWGFERTRIADWLNDEAVYSAMGMHNGRFPFSDMTCFMNPPFSLAVEFTEKAISRGFRKIICFQRFAWYESNKRKEFWDKHPPNRVYICGDRADCWRHDIPKEQRNSSTPTAHAWFVFDRDAPAGTLLGRIYKNRGDLLI